MVDKIEVFISYAQEDEGLRKELETQLGTLERQELIKIWHNRKVSAGADLKQEITRHLNTAQIILLLISPAFMASDDPYGTEMKRAMERCNAGEVRVIPILLRPVHYKGAPFEHLSMLPSNGKPVTSSSWRHHDEAFFDVVEGIQEVVEKLTTKTPTSPPMSRQAQDVLAKPLEEKTLTNITFSNGYALLVGVGADPPVTVEDATALRDVLVNPSRAAYPPDQVELLTETKANRQNILEAFDKLNRQVNSNPDATVIVYFSGHGVQIERQGKPTEYFLVPYGYNASRRADTAISGAEFTARIEAIKARKLVVLLDCCHAGGVPALKEPEEVAVKSVPLPPDLLNILETGSGRVVVASSLENEKSYTGTPYSIFTTCLMEALAGKAAVKKDGFARILDVLIYLLDQVPQRAFGPQHPFVNKVLNLNDNFPLCYYAGGSKDVPGEAPAPTSSAAPTGLTAGKRARLEQELNGYQGERVLLAELVGRIRRELIIETSVVRKFQLEQQLQENEASLTRLDGRIDEIEQTLTQLEPKEEHSAALKDPPTSIQPGTTSSKSITQAEHFDVFLSYSHMDADWVEHLARRLEDEHGLRVWLDKWVLVAGQPWQQAMARGIDQAGCCAVCIGEYTPIGWFKREIESALDRQTRVPSFRVIPVLLPKAKRGNVDDFLELNAWVDFRSSDQDYAFHVLVCGVKGISPGRWPPK